MVRINILLLDRGFYSIDVVKLLMRLNIGFIMPMRGKRLEKKKGSYRTAYLMKSVKDGKPISQLISAVSVIKYNRGKRFGEHRAMQLCFIIHRIETSLYCISQLYCKRFGIESSYKLNKGNKTKNQFEKPCDKTVPLRCGAHNPEYLGRDKTGILQTYPQGLELMITQYDFAGILVDRTRIYYGEKKDI